MRKEEPANLLIEIFSKVTVDIIGLTIDDRCGYPNAVTHSVGISQEKLDVLLYAIGVLALVGGKRTYRMDSLDIVVNHFKKVNRPFAVIYHRFPIGNRRVSTNLITLGHPTVKSEIDRPQRIGGDLHKRIDKFCASHSIPQFLR